MKSWYLIHTKIRQEQIAKEQLERQGYETYLPLAPNRRHRRGRTIRVIAPMFPRYLFIYLSDETDDWRPIRSTIGVTNLIRFGQTPARIPTALIAELKQRENADGIQVLPNKDLQHGDKIRIAEGPFEGYEGIFQVRSSADRVIILIKIAEGYAKLKIAETAIDAESSNVEHC